VFTSFLIALFLQRFGTAGVFGFIAFSMAVVMVSIGAFGPRTNKRALEEISAGGAAAPFPPLSPGRRTASWWP
jgi:putative MFS transporter